MTDNKTDLVGVDKEIYQLLNLRNPKSFLLFAGAGSGKTRTLVNILQEIRNKNLQYLIQKGQRIAVITYTNAACEEIQHRLHYDPVFSISTIHSFIWELINPFTLDIKEWLEVKLNNDISKLTIAIDKARDKQGVTAVKNAKSKAAKIKRLQELESVQSFVYSPISHKSGKGTLNHAEVIAIGAEFIAKRPLMQRVLVNRFPILLIDESQDTVKDLLEAFIFVQQENSNVFSLGLFGDLMQRIYSGGKDDLDKSLPKDWKTPAKKINYRSPKRVVELINSIRMEGDGKEQVAYENATDGFVRLFIVESGVISKNQVESKARQHMAVTSYDEFWNKQEEVKTLILEHAMAAKRGGFSDFFTPLSTVEKLRDGALNGTNSTIKFITDELLPLIDASIKEDDFGVIRLIKKHSKLLNNENVDFLRDPIGVLETTNELINELKNKTEGQEISLRNVLEFINENMLLEIPDILQEILPAGSGEDEETFLPEQSAWNKSIDSSLRCVMNYENYISGKSGFSTHQGVKGLEFERVMAVIDDEDSKGFLFKYEKLFGVVELSKKDKENEAQGVDSVMSRTRRLLYVICSRAEKSLAIVAYTKDPKALKNRVMESNWFSKDEIVML